MDTGHNIAWEDISVLGREGKDYPRKVREAIEIRNQQPSLNRDQGLELPALYNRVLSSRSLDQTSRTTNTHTSDREQTTMTSGGDRGRGVTTMPSGGGEQ